MSRTVIIALSVLAIFGTPVWAQQQPAIPGAASRPIEAPPMPLTEDEALPPPGKGNLYSDAQVRYCLAQLTRIDAVRPLLNRYEREEVEQFNALVADFNTRCGSYRYKGDALAESKAWLEDNRDLIERTARQNYMARFPGEPKLERRAKKTTTLATQPPPDITASAKADEQPKPATPPAKAKPAESARPPTAQPPRATPPTTTPQATTPQTPTTPKKQLADTMKPASVPPKPWPGHTDKPADAANKPPADNTAAATGAVAGPKPSVATSKPADAASPSGTVAQSQSAPEVIAAPETPLISKPHMFPDTPADSAVKPAVPSTPAATAAASSGSESKPTKAREKPNIPTPAAASTATNKPKETTDKPEEPKREAAAPARKPSPSGKPQGAPAARKSEPPAQVAAVTPKSEPGSGPEAALARLTQEIQRTSSQVLSQPAGASQTNDVTTQVEVRFAAGGWVRSIVVGESSGSQDLDEQALALARATRFPDVPEELRSRDFSVRYPVTFRAAR